MFSFNSCFNFLLEMILDLEVAKGWLICRSVPVQSFV